jgi:hypothetical protein
VAEVSIDAAAMRNTVTVEQRRRRVYISLDEAPFATRSSRTSPSP